MLEALHLTKSFIGPPAVDSVSFTIHPGEILEEEFLKPLLDRLERAPD